MEVFEVIGRAVSSIAWATGFVYIVGIVTKTWLISNGDATPEELKDWLHFYKKKDKKL